MNKALAAFALVVTLALAAVGVIAKRQATANAALRGENATLTQALQTAAEQRKKDAAVLASRATKNAATARESASARASLSAAVVQEREWADQPVPEAVQRALEEAE